jgi:hypothetical protein
MTTITRKIQLMVTTPDDLFEKERKEYKDFVWKKLKDANKLNFNLHQLAVKKLFGVDSLTEIRLNDDHKYIELKNQYISNTKNKKLENQINERRNVIKKQVIVDLGINLYTIKGRERTLNELLRNFLYRELVNYVKKLPEDERHLNTYTIYPISNYIYNKYKNDQAEVKVYEFVHLSSSGDFFKGNKTIGNYKITQPIPINIRSPLKEGKGKFWFDKKNDDYYFRFRSLTGELVSLKLYFGRNNLNDRIIVDRIYDNHPDYEFSDSSIQIKNNKIFLLLITKVPSEKKKFDSQ